MSKEGGSERFPRPLTAGEHDLIEALLGAVRKGVSRYISQLDYDTVVACSGDSTCLLNWATGSGATPRTGLADGFDFFPAYDWGELPSWLPMLIPRFTSPTRCMVNACSSFPPRASK